MNYVMHYGAGLALLGITTMMTKLLHTEVVLEMTKLATGKMARLLLIKIK